MSQGDLLKAGEPVDLSNCDREPIHIPGSIQPHGVLFAARPSDRVIVQASVNTDIVLGVAHAAVLGAKLTAILGEATTDELLSPLLSSPGRRVSAVKASLQGRPFDVIAHRASGLLIVEIEPGPAGIEHELLAVHELAREAVERLRGTIPLADLWPELAHIVRCVSGFDRVMVYRFAPDGAGQVIAETVAEGVESYLGLWYPASDVPQQARSLYVRNRVRQIVDAAYTPAPIVPADSPVTAAPLDLSCSTLRSVSPIHCQYLANMGVRASMSISLVDNDQLWGLVACHHRSPRHVRYQRRMLCALLGDVASWMIGPKRDTEQADARVRAAAVRSTLVERMSARPDLGAALVGSSPSALDLVLARGFAVVHEGAIRTLGDTPALVDLTALLDWLRAQADGDILVTDALAERYPPAADMQASASGLLAVRVSREQDFMLLWFRPEVVREVSWAGDPRSPVDTSTGKIGPRQSFALWKETVRGRSLPWAPWEIEAADQLRVITVSVVLQKAAELFRLNVDLKNAVQSRDDFLAMASHELRTPTTTLNLQVAGLRRLAEADRLARPEVLARLEKVARQVDRIEMLVSRLLDVSRITAGRLDLERSRFDLADLAREVTERYIGAPLTLTAEGDTSGTWDRFRLDQVLTNLTSNAIKYGAGHAVTITIRGERDRVVLAVHDEGLGVNAEARERIFERFERAVSPQHFAGFGLGLWITRRVVEEHGGRISVESAPGKGSTFTVELPR